ncbi:Vacuolar sorting protein 18 [Cardamine amara subsp. amara]|uniref:Vacuolar sorting protein 18 n=1 Tax=Cardamine amara subsp. amara TaxID=228776 RepID=A0ABD1AZ26_CARAN
MNDVTCGADNIRNDISALTQRYAVINHDDKCGVCKRKILMMAGDFRMAPFYICLSLWALFPCTVPYHTLHKLCTPRASKSR